jgi:uncharacterized protein YlaI
MEYIEAKCLLCSKTYQLGEQDKDFKKMSNQEKPGTFICDLCSNRVRYESDEKRKNPKPVSN